MTLNLRMAFFDCCLAAISRIKVLFVHWTVTFLATFEYSTERGTTAEGHQETEFHMKRTFLVYITLDIVLLVITWVWENDTPVLRGLLWPFLNAEDFAATVS